MVARIGCHTLAAQAPIRVTVPKSRLLGDGLDGFSAAASEGAAGTPEQRTGRPGCFNALHAELTFQVEPALRLLLRASRKPEVPWFLILDEMNLARERSFAPFLLAMINHIAKARTGRRVIPAGSTYRIRGGRYMLDGSRVFRSYLQAGPAWCIEAGKRRILVEDISAALRVAGISSCP